VRITHREMELLIEHSKKDKMLGVAIKGALSQIRHYNHLVSQGYNVIMNDSNNAGLPDFTIGDHLIEHKRARNERYADGSIKVELQKTRASGKCKSNRLYDKNFCDVLTVDVSEHTGILNDYRYIAIRCLPSHSDFPKKLKVFHREDHNWKRTLEQALSESR